jgi:AraC family transcriptional activator of mtrCDE
VTYQSRDQVSQADLEILLAALHVDHLKLEEYEVRPGEQLYLSASDTSQLYYGLRGDVSLSVSSENRIELQEGTLAIIPPCLHARSHKLTSASPHDAEQPPYGWDATRSARIIAGSLTVSCGYVIDVFHSIAEPIIEHFESTDKIDVILALVAAEASATYRGSTAAAGALMKHVSIKILQRVLSANLIGKTRLAVLIDPNIAAALADMVARPGASHSVVSLARGAGMSRTAFMIRFNQLLDSSPMVLMREIRMRKAATYLAMGSPSIDEVARSVGYTSRSSFVRAFRNIHGIAPSEYRAISGSSSEAEICAITGKLAFD